MKKKFLIVVADYYKDISEALLKSALKIIPKKNIIKIIKVPGAFEIPVTISKNIKKSIFYNSIISNSKFLSFLLIEFITLSFSIVGPFKQNVTSLYSLL